MNVGGIVSEFDQVEHPIRKTFKDDSVLLLYAYDVNKEISVSKSFKKYNNYRRILFTASIHLIYLVEEYENWKV